MKTTPYFQNFNRLSSQILLRVSFFGAVIVFIATILSYYNVYSNSKEKNIQYLQQYMQVRSRHENKVFSETTKRLDFFRDAFMDLYLSDIDFTKDDFWRLYEVDKDGAIRMKKRFFDGHTDQNLGKQWGVTSFIGNNQSVASPDFQRRLLISYILVNRYGPAWWPEGGLHVSFPENAITVFSPVSPWGLEARPDLPMNELGTIKATLQSTNPDRTPVWTSLYYDETAEQWTITYELPVDYKGRHLCNPSMDVSLKEIMDRLVSEHPAGAYNFIMSSNGDLIASPRALSEEQKWKGMLSRDKIEEPDILRMYSMLHGAVTRQEKDIYVIDDTEGDSYFLSFHIPGPDWWFVMVYPKSIVFAEAHQASRIVLLLGLLLFVMYYLVIYLVINRQVRAPLQRMLKAVSLVARNRHEELVENPELLPVKSKNEIGQLARAFLDMSRHVHEVNQSLENRVESRTRELEQANAQLRNLSLLDGLTGIHNRRSFDRDIAIVFNQAKQGVEFFSLMLIDLDKFKHYNDKYGHTAGDRALQNISKQIARTIRNEDRVYRYGGEELAVIFNSADKDTAQRLGQRIQDAIRKLAMPHIHSAHEVVTISAGITSFSNEYDSYIEMINAVDALLYEAKSRGGNTLVTDTPDTE